MNGQWLGSRSIRTNWATRKPPATKAEREYFCSFYFFMNQNFLWNFRLIELRGEMIEYRIKLMLWMCQYVDNKHYQLRISFFQRPLVVHSPTQTKIEEKVSFYQYKHFIYSDRKSWPIFFFFDYVWFIRMEYIKYRRKEYE